MLTGLATIAGCSGEPTTPPGAPPIIIAHRGASYDAPEHTLAAYDLALEQEADYIELDVARTKDGVLVVIHDPTADRTLRGPAASCTGLISERTTAQLALCDAGSWFNSAFPSRANPSYASLKLPTLEEVISRYAGSTRFYIEIKDPDMYPGIEADLSALLEARGLSPGLSDGMERIYIQSFSSASLRRMKALAPGLPLILIIGAVSPAIIRESIGAITGLAHGIAPRWESTDRAVVDTAHSRCLAVHPYTVDDTQQLEFLLTLGIDGFFTNRPGFVRLAIEAAGYPDTRLDHCTI